MEDHLFRLLDTGTWIHDKLDRPNSVNEINYLGLSLFDSTHIRDLGRFFNFTPPPRGCSKYDIRFFSLGDEPQHDESTQMHSFLSGLTIYLFNLHLTKQYASILRLELVPCKKSLYRHPKQDTESV